MPKAASKRLRSTYLLPNQHPIPSYIHTPLIFSHDFIAEYPIIKG